jgi:hypothetical protein
MTDPDARTGATYPIRVGSEMAPSNDATPKLLPGTRVQLKYGAKQKGTVMPYMRECSQGLLGSFPVQLDNAIWQICKASDVVVLESKDAD